MHSFRARILVWGWGVLLVLLGLFAFSLSWVERELVTEAEQRASRHLESFRWLFSDHPAFVDPARFETWVQALGARSGVRVSVIVKGKVLADSDVRFEDLERLDDHFGRPEVAEAKDAGHGLDTRYSSTLKKDMLYAAQKVQAAGALPAGVLRVAIPVSEVRARLGLVRNGLFWGFVSALVLVPCSPGSCPAV